MTPRYKSEARVLVEGRENIFLRPEAEKALIDRGAVDPETVTSQVQLVLSRDLAREVIKQLKLDRNCRSSTRRCSEFSPLSVLRTIGILKDPMSMTLEERVLAAYYDRLNAYRDRQVAGDRRSNSSRPIPSLPPASPTRSRRNISRSSRWPSRTRRAPPANGCRASSKSCATRCRRPRPRSRTFRAKSNLFVGSNNTSLSNQQLTELSSQVSAARAQKADAEARARLIREALRAGPVARIPPTSPIPS